MEYKLLKIKKFFIAYWFARYVLLWSVIIFISLSFGIYRSTWNAATIIALVILIIFFIYYGVLTAIERFLLKSEYYEALKYISENAADYNWYTVRAARYYMKHNKIHDE
ncbi:hypothetical protein [Mycoplasma hafezii]|uniref:hypothetical protein n=1 Tax=Mycoplasma hafezii TaxID=525886 RepID=UPI003CF21576